MDDQALSSYITALGQIAATKKPKNIAPGGMQGGTPAPMKIRSDNGITDSDFVRQIIAAAQAGSQPQMAMNMGNNTGMPSDMTTGPQPGQEPAQSPQDGMQGLAQMFAGLGQAGGKQ